MNHARIACLLIVLALAGCQAAPPAVQSGAIAVPPLQGGTVYRVLPRESELRLLVGRAGPLASLGHNHVITGPLEGEVHVAGTAAASGFRLRIRVAGMAVDPPAARAEEGDDFESVPSAEARTGTRQNMLGEALLQADRFGEIGIASLAMRGPRWNPDVRARVTVRGVSKVVEFPAAVFVNDDRLVVIATFEVRQSEFGIEPFSALGGALQVADAIRVRVRVVAERAP